jgi:hypothetical protein
VGVRHREVCFAQSDGYGPARPVVRLRAGWIGVELVQMDSLRQHSDARRPLGVLCRSVIDGHRDGLDEIVPAVHAVQSRHTDHQMVLLHRHSAAGAIRRDVAGGAVDLGVIDVTEPELDLGAEVVADA